MGTEHDGGTGVKLSEVQLYTLSMVVLNLEGRNVNLYDSGFNDIQQDDKQLEHKTCLRRAGIYKIFTELI